MAVVAGAGIAAAVRSSMIGRMTKPGTIATANRQRPIAVATTQRSKTSVKTS